MLHPVLKIGNEPSDKAMGYISRIKFNFGGAGGRSDQCSVKAWVNNIVVF